MNELLIPITNACTLITLNYVALKIRNKVFIESNELFVIPVLTGIAAIIMMMIQPFPSNFALDLRFVPIIMAGLRFGLPIALLSTILPSIYYIGLNESAAVFELSLSLILPAIISSIYHRKEYNSGHTAIRMIDGIKICSAFFIARLAASYFFVPLQGSDWIVSNIVLFLISCAAVIALIAMFNDENKIWLMQRELELQANQDGLTKLPNLRSFMKTCTNTLQTRRISILMIDIDHFKIYNDRLGHLQGDQLLREIGRILRHSIGEKDYLARYGGEEFIIMCHSYNMTKLRKLGQNLCNIIANYPFEGREVQPNKQISISVGIAVALKVNDDIKRLISEADDALYVSKHAGRNQYSFNQSS